jgi:pilus assembly protein TadC
MSPRWRRGAGRWPRSSGSSGSSGSGRSGGSAGSAGAELPSALDLLAACVSAGALLDSALAAVAAAFDGPVGLLLTDIARLTALGAPPEDAWSAALRDPGWAPVARAVIRAHHSGAALADVLNRVAAELRRDLRAQAETAAARAGVKAVLPLGLCFLPAFLLIGVVPVVAGFTTSLW